jgi:Zn-dependent metalloprotease
MKATWLFSLVFFGSFLFLACDKDSDSDSYQESVDEGETVEEAYARLVETYQIHEVYWNEYGTPEWINCSITIENPPDDLVECYYTFLTDYRGLFGIRNPRSELRIRRFDINQSGHSFVSCDQYYEGIPVYAAGWTLHFLDHEEITSMNGTLVPRIDISIDPFITEEQVHVIMAELAESPVETCEFRLTELIIYRDLYAESLDVKLAWKGEVYCGDDDRGRGFYVDAQNGELLAEFATYIP